MDFYIVFVVNVYSEELSKVPLLGKRLQPASSGTGDFSKGTRCNVCWIPMEEWTSTPKENQSIIHHEVSVLLEFLILGLSSNCKLESLEFEMYHTE